MHEKGVKNFVDGMSPYHYNETMIVSRITTAPNNVASRLRLAGFVLVVAAFILSAFHCHGRCYAQKKPATAFEVNEFLPPTVFYQFKINDFEAFYEIGKTSSVGVYASTFFDSHLKKEWESQLGMRLQHDDVNEHIPVLANARPESASCSVYRSDNATIVFFEIGAFNDNEKTSLMELLSSVDSRRNGLKTEGDNTAPEATEIFQVGSLDLFFRFCGNRLFISNSQDELIRANKQIEAGVDLSNTLFKNSRKLQTIEKRILDRQQPVAFFYVDPFAAIDKAELQKTLGDEVYSQMLEFGAFDIICAGGALLKGQDGQLWELRCFAPIAQPRTGFFDSIEWQTLDSELVSMVPGDSEFLVAYSFKIASTVNAIRSFFDRVLDSQFSSVFIARYLSLNSFHITNDHIFTGQQLKFEVDTDENLELSRTLVHSLGIDQSVNFKLVSEIVNEQFSTEDNETSIGPSWKVWSQKEAEWKRKKEEYERFAESNPNVPSNISYPRLTSMLTEKSLLRATNMKSVKKCILVQSSDAPGIDKQDWYRTATNNSTAAHYGQPHFALVSRNGSWIKYFLNIVDDQTGFTTHTLPRASARFVELTSIPRLEKDTKPGFPVLSVMAWDKEDGLLFSIAEFQDVDEATQVED